MPEQPTADERRALYARLRREELRKLTPNVIGIGTGPARYYSGAQVAYAKGRAGRRFEEMEREGWSSWQR